jgi:plasmid stabilization system protein ParE
MGEAFLTARADLDIADIALYLSKDNPSLAVAIWHELIDAAQRLADGLAIGHVHGSVPDPLLVYRVRRWFLVYEPGTNPLTIRRVLDARRDLENLAY